MIILLSWLSTFRFFMVFRSLFLVPLFGLDISEYCNVVGDGSSSKLLIKVRLVDSFNNLCDGIDFRLVSASEFIDNMLKFVEDLLLLFGRSYGLWYNIPRHSARFGCSSMRSRRQGCLSSRLKRLGGWQLNGRLLTMRSHKDVSVDEEQSNNFVKV